MIWLKAILIVANVTLTPGASPTLHWTAPGDDGTVGTAAEYDVRVSQQPITSATWSMATELQGEPTPSVAGSIEAFTVEGLEPNTTYYFAVKTADEVPNWSLLSNVIEYTTPGGCDDPMRYDVNCNGVVDISDLTFMIDYMFHAGPAPTCGRAGDINCDDSVDIADLMELVDYMFLGGGR